MVQHAAEGPLTGRVELSDAERAAAGCGEVECPVRADALAALRHSASSPLRVEVTGQ